MEKSLQEQANDLMAKGYRRVSNKYGSISRIDRPDWIAWMSKNHNGHIGCCVADYYDEKGESARWCDTYRRLHSKDKIELGMGSPLAKLIDSSDWDPIGYVDLEGNHVVAEPDEQYFLVNKTSLLTLLERQIKSINLWSTNMEISMTAKSYNQYRRAVLKLKDMWEVAVFVLGEKHMIGYHVYFNTRRLDVLEQTYPGQ